MRQHRDDGSAAATRLSAFCSGRGSRARSVRVRISQLPSGVPLGGEGARCGCRNEAAAERSSTVEPDGKAQLLRVLGRDEAAVLAASLQRTQLGFALVNVIVTSQRVLYTIFSMVVVAVYLIPK